MRKMALSIWSVSWVIASILFLYVPEPSLATSKDPKKGPSQTKRTEAKHDKSLTENRTNKLGMKLGFIILYLPEWSPSTPQTQNSQLLRRVTPDKCPSLSRQAMEASSVLIITDQRSNQQVASQRLQEIDTEQDEPVTFLVIGGWPVLMS